MDVSTFSISKATHTTDGKTEACGGEEAEVHTSLTG